MREIDELTLGAEKLLGAAKHERKIVIEIKVFNNPSLITELEKAVGQYSILRFGLSGM